MCRVPPPDEKVFLFFFTVVGLAYILIDGHISNYIIYYFLSPTIFRTQPVNSP